MVVARPSEARKLRLQVFKQSKKGLKFAFNAGAGVNADFSNLPAGPDDFIKAVFDVHGAQIIDDLHAIEKWTDPNTPLSGPLAGLGVDYAKKLLSDITGVEHFEEARGRLLEFLKQWDSLPHRVSTMVYKLVEENRTEELEAVRAICTALAKGTTAPIETELRKVAFFSTPAGRFLEAIATDGVLPLLTSGVPDSIRETAETATKLLDSAGLEKTLRGLQSALLARLNLDQLDAKALDDWLKLKLSHFLGRTIDSNQDIQDVRKAIASLLAKRKQFYEKAKAALTRRYEAHFAATYSKATTDTALIDAEFDFDQDAAAAAELLSAALDGDFKTLFTRESAAVQLNQAVLTHGITRNSHVEFSLPSYERSTEHLNEALAKVEAVQDGERLLVYDLNASDTVSEKNRRNSRLAVAARPPSCQGHRRARPQRRGVHLFLQLPAGRARYEEFPLAQRGAALPRAIFQFAVQRRGFHRRLDFRSRQADRPHRVQRDGQLRPHADGAGVEPTGRGCRQLAGCSEGEESAAVCRKCRGGFRRV